MKSACTHGKVNQKTLKTQKHKCESDDTNASCSFVSEMASNVSNKCSASADSKAYILAQNI